MTKPADRVFTQEQVDEMMMRHRRGLQERVRDQDELIRKLRHQLSQLMVWECNPVVKMLLTSLGVLRKGESLE